MKCIRNRIAIIVVILLLFEGIYSIGFVSTYKDHHCNDDCCPVCLVITQCIRHLSNVAGGVVVYSILLFSASNLVSAVNKVITLVVSKTLVVEKVRLNN